MQLLENYSKGVYVSSMEAMDAVLAEADLDKQASELAQETLLIDTHLDTPYELQKRMQDISSRIEGGHFDYVRARQGGLDALFMAVYVPPEYEEKGGARAFADRTIDLVESFASQWPDRFVLARSPDEIRAHFGSERVSILLGMENGSALEGNLSNLEQFHDRCIRYVTLTHSKNNQICDSSFDDGPKWHGLSPFGRQVIAEMNRLGMIVDISHVSDEAAHIDHVVRLVGVDYAGLGSDFDGVTEVPVGLEDVSRYPNLIRELLRKGYGEPEIRKICGGNFLRVWTEIQRTAKPVRL